MTRKIVEKLKPLFEPESIAVIGASNNPRKWGNWMVTRPVSSGYRGRIFPINPKEKTIYGLKAYPSVLEVPDPIELAIITLPAHMVPSAMKDFSLSKRMIILCPHFQSSVKSIQGLTQHLLGLTPSDHHSQLNEGNP